jgi:hypothetical protein
MQESTLWAIFSLLKPDEISLLNHLIDTPLFKLSNRHTDTVNLFHYLQQLVIQHDTSEIPSKQQIAERLFGHRSQPETELRKSMSNLLGILKKFVLFHQFTSDVKKPNEILLRQIQTDMGLLKWLAARSGDISQPAHLPKTKNKRPSKTRVVLSHQYKLVQHATSVSSEATQMFNQRQYSDWLLNRFWQEYEMYDYFGMQRSVDEQEHHLLAALEALDTFYYQLKMSMVVHLQVNLLTHLPTENSAAAIQQQINHTSHISQHAPVKLADNSGHTVYHAAFQMLLNQDVNDPYYETIANMVQSGNLDLPNEVIQTLRIVLNAYCAIMYNRTGSSIFLQRRFEIQKTDLENELMTNGNSITATRLCATVSNALLTGPQNFEWVASLIERFRNGAGILATDTPREIYKVNKAHLLFYQCAYREAANELIGYDWYSRINDAQILLLAIRIDLKTQFELGNFDTDYMIRTLDATEKRIVRLSDINEQLQSMTLHFLKLFRQICAAKAKGKLFYSQDGWEGKIADWKKSLESKPVAEKTWMLNHVLKMENE